MSVKKKTRAGKKSQLKIDPSEYSSPCPPMGYFRKRNLCCGSEFVKKLFITIFGIIVVYVAVLLAVIIRNQLEAYNYIGQADRAERTITIDAQAKVTATPDIAMTTMGMVAEAKTVVEAQEENTVVMNKLITRLKGLGIEEEDIQTGNYNIYPMYDYLEETGRELNGYEVRQSVTIKIRDLEKANQVLGLAGEVGVNTVSGLQFTIDDTEVYKQQAREQALEKVWEKARVLSSSLGVRPAKVVAYNEYEAGQFDGMASYSESVKFGMGGGAPMPDIEPGSTEVVMNVSVTFEIR